MKRCILILPLLLFNFFIVDAQINEEFIKTEFNRLLHVSKPNFPVQLEIVQVGEMVSIKDEGKVVFALDQYSKFSTGLSDSGKKFLVQILLAHELSHQFQFNWLKGKTELLDKPVFRMLLEAQADLLAGYSFGSLLMYDITRKNISESEVSTNDFYDVFEIILDMGIAENSMGTHPSRNDRLMSLKHGMDFGMAFFAIDEAKLHPEIIISYYGSLENYDKKIRKTLNLLDFNYSTENPFSWCYKLAKRIVNYDSNVAKNLVLIRPEGGLGIDWKTTQENPIVNYSFDYMNISDRTIIVEMEVYVSHVLRASSDNSVYHTKRNSRLHRLVFEPREIRTVRGSLNWDEVVTDDSNMTSLYENKMPTLVFPHSGSIESWMTCKYLDQVESFDQTGSIMNYLELESRSKPSSFKLAANIEQLLRYLKYDSEKLSVGVGDFHFYDSTNVFFVEYACPIYFDENADVKTILNFPSDNILKTTKPDDIELFISYVPFEHGNKALEKFNFLINAFDAVLNKHTKHDNFDKEKYKEASYEGPEYDIDLLMYFNEKDGDWSVDIEIYKSS